MPEGAYRAQPDRPARHLHLQAPLRPPRSGAYSHRGLLLELDEEVRCDIAEFRRLVEAGRPTAPGVDVAALEGAVSLYRGAFAGGGRRGLGHAERPSWSASSSFTRAGPCAGVRARRNQAAVAVAERVLAIDPFLEPLHLALLRHQVALGRLGRQAALPPLLPADAGRLRPRAEPAATSLLASPAAPRARPARRTL